MDTYDLKEIINSSENKFSILFSILSDVNAEKKYNIVVKDLLEIINEYLDDNQKMELLNAEYTKRPMLRSLIINSITDSKAYLKILYTNNIVMNMDYYSIEEIYNNMNEEDKKIFLMDERYIREVIKLEDNKIITLIEGIIDESVKEDLIKRYQLDNYQTTNIIKKFSDEGKQRNIINNSFGINANNVIDIMQSMQIDSLIEFLNQNSQYINQNEIMIYRITQNLSTDKQNELVSKIDEL